MWIDLHDKHLTRPPRFIDPRVKTAFCNPTQFFNSRYHLISFFVQLFHIFLELLHGFSYLGN